MSIDNHIDMITKKCKFKVKKILLRGLCHIGSLMTSRYYTIIVDMASNLVLRVCHQPQMCI